MIKNIFIGVALLIVTTWGSDTPELKKEKAGIYFCRDKGSTTIYPSPTVVEGADCYKEILHMGYAFDKSGVLIPKEK